MNKQTEALKMAIEYIERSQYEKRDDVIQACKEALEPQTNPEFDVVYHNVKQPTQEPLTRAQQVIRANNSAQEPLLITRIAFPESNIQKPAQEPVAEVDFKLEYDCGLIVDRSKVHNGQKLYTHPAPSWQGLSDDDMSIIFDKFDWKEVEIAGEYLDLFKFARAIEAALKEKNER